MTPRLVSWAEFHEKCEELAEMVATRYQDDPERWPELCLVGILRGGMIVANVLSYLLEDRHAIDVCMDVVGIRRYPREAREPLRHSNDAVYHNPNSLGLDVFTVLVDEVAATGITLNQGARAIRNATPPPGPDLKIHTACLFSVGQKFADDVVEVVPVGTWVFFPWDSEVVENVQVRG